MFLKLILTVEIQQNHPQLTMNKLVLPCSVVVRVRTKYTLKSGGQRYRDNANLREAHEFLQRKHRRRNQLDEEGKL